MGCSQLDPMLGSVCAHGVPDHIRAAWCGRGVAVNVGTYTHANADDLAAGRDVLATICETGRPS
jgi:hypothetical protein